MLLPTRKHLCRLSREYVAIDGDPEIREQVRDLVTNEEIRFSGNNGRRRDRAQRLERAIGRNLPPRRCSLTALLGFCERGWLTDEHHWPTLRDCTMEQTLGEGRGHQHADVERAGGFAEDGHVLRVATKPRDVLLHPSQRGDLIEDALVSRCAPRRLASQYRVREESE